MSQISDSIAAVRTSLDAAIARVQADETALTAEVARLQALVDAGTATPADVAALAKIQSDLDLLDTSVQPPPTPVPATT